VEVQWSAPPASSSAGARAAPPPPTAVVVLHRKAPGEGGELMHAVATRAAGQQAAEVAAAITGARARYYLEPLLDMRGWRQQPMVAAEHGADQLMPDVLPSMEWARVWAAWRPGSRAVSVWRPVGPPGYASLGDVAVAGDEPPARPSMMYKDVPAVAGSDALGEGPRLAPPSGFALMYRSLAGMHPVTIWAPLAPRGYVALGAVVVPAMDEPMPGAVRCVRSDLVAPAPLAGSQSPVFSLRETASDGTEWACSLWPVDNTAQTVAVTKSPRTPPPAAWTPIY
jgi:vacuolar protein sorting-associated protein 13A/C